VEFHLTATRRHLPYGITVLPATRHKWTRPAFTPASKPVRFYRYLRLCFICGYSWGTAGVVSMDTAYFRPVNDYRSLGRAPRCRPEEDIDDVGDGSATLIDENEEWAKVSNK